MSSARPVAFATEELYPFGPGGIGRLVHHLVFQALAERTGDVHLFVPAALGASDARVKAIFGPRVSASSFEAASGSAFARSEALAAHVFEHCAAREPFEWLELPDFRGLGFVTLHRAATQGLRGAPELRVRVHGPNSIITWHEQLRVDRERAAEFDLERSSLLLADTVLAPLAAVRDCVATFFRLSERWRSRVRVSLPPRGAAPPPGDAPQGPVRRVVFPTKVQGIKRPDLFVSGMTRLLQRRPEWQGQVVLAAHRDPRQEEALLHAVPAELRGRFEWAQWDEATRARQFAGQVVVIPSDFETLNLAAWEAAALRARVVASTRCPAFMPPGPWSGWPGFFGFDGTAEGLAEAVGRALDAPTPPGLDAPPSALLPGEARASSPRTVSPSEIAVLSGGLEEWTRQLGVVSAPFVLLLSSPEETAVDRFKEAAAAALARRSAAVLVAAAGEQVCSPTQAFQRSPLPSGPVVVTTELAREVISPRHGRRSLVAIASQRGLECLFHLVPTRAVGADAEDFPPVGVDVHPLAARVQRDSQPSLKTQLLERARVRLGGLLGPLDRLRR